MSTGLVDVIIKMSCKNQHDNLYLIALYEWSLTIIKTKTDVSNNG